MGRRPHNYRKKYLPIIVSMAAEGKSDVEIARTMGIARSTVQSWYATHKDLAEAVEDARELVIRTDVEAALFKRARGFTAEERVTEINPRLKDADGKDMVVGLKVRERYFPPNTAAINIILTNKLPTEYKNRASIDHTGKVGVKHYIGWSPAAWDDGDALPEGQPMRNVTGDVPQLEAAERAGDAE
jgi:hypothetical protein